MAFVVVKPGLAYLELNNKYKKVPSYLLGTIFLINLFAKLYSKQSERRFK